MSYKFGKSSQTKLQSCHPALQLILETAIELSPIDFGIAEGFRDIKVQHEYFIEGKSKLDGVHKKSKHNYFPSLAADIYPYVKGKADWNNETLSYLAGFIQAIAERLYQEQMIEHKIRWGGNWDGDGEMITDQSFDDRPHLELISGK